MNAWDNLSLTEKSDMIRVAVENGITTLPEIRKAYNEFAEGGGVDNINTYETDGYKPSENIKSRIAHYEGKAMTGARDPISGKWGKNSSFEAEARGFYKALPVSIREQVLSNPELADSLYSYSYNVGAGNFKKRVVPALERYYAGIGSVKDIEDSMWATHDSKLRGLQRRRAEEKAGVRNALMGEAMPLLQIEELPEFTPFNPQAFSAFMGVDGNYGNYVAPQVMDVEEPLVQAAMESAYSPEQIEREERAQGLRNLGLAMSIMRGGQSPSEGSSLWDTVGLLTGSQYKSGGKIHIKPENRGKFTALKKRTGHSATWFKEHGTPAQKKMATFALNARHWKHGLGGNLFSGEDESTQQMNNGLNLYRRTNNLGETEYIYQETPDSEEILLTPTNKRFSDDPTNWDYKDASGREYSPRMTATYNPGEIREDTRGPLERMVDNYFGELKYQVSNNVPISGKYTMPAIAAAPFLAWAGETAYPYISTALANPYVDAGISSAFAGHGLNHAVNEGIDGWGDAAMTALEITPLGRLVKPIYEGVVWPGVDATVASGKRFILDVGDRYQGMKDAAAYRSANGTLDARTIANIKWWENGGTTPGINRAGVSNYGDFRTYYLDNPKNPSEGHYPSPIIEKGGNMTLTTHLGGATPGDFSQKILPMSKSEKAALLRYMNGVPEHTYFGEVGKTKNYAEQYFNDDPSIIKAIKDAARKKKEINEPYWNEQEHIDLFINEENPIEREFQKHLYDANEPLSVDSYKTILQEAAKDNSKFALRYDSSPMGMFNPQGVYEEEFYNSLQSLTPKEQVDAINKWMKSYYPKARLAYLKNGEVMIPRPLLMYKGKK